jgi:hypothetical protein
LLQYSYLADQIKSIESSHLYEEADLMLRPLSYPN